ncbi:MAG: TonB-dependent receptor [Aquamicrobium sp.]|uniref:TonB-dependent receptor plug domain-containing protein n=1 Tax=Aquamicrobium sp. TaxID=1872579 RepID=UPI00349E65DB|nr:TonB-dependent receptor [Aquamicrobium sp.]
MNRFLISTASALALMAGAAQAQDAAQTDEQGVTTLEAITVTANRTPTEKSKTGSKVEQVTQGEIETKSLVSVTDYLTRLPGISVTSSGGIGTQTGISVRGLGGAYVKTLYNGIDVSDTTGTQVLTQYQYLLSGGVTGMEILKGSQSTLYGSSAIAGVVDITTLGEVEDGISHTVHVEGGSFGTVRGRYGLAGAQGGSRIAANVTGFRNDGISAKAGGTERDGYENVTFDLAAEHRINEAFSVFGSLLYIDAKTEFDGGSADDADSYELATMMGGRVGFNLDLLDGRLKNTFSVQGFKSDRESIWAGSPASFIGTRQKFDYQGSFEATDRVLLQYGVDHERQEAEDGGGGTPLGKIDLTGVWVQAVVEPVDNLVLTAGVRHDDHSMFGGHTTWRATASYLFDQTGTRLHSSFGTGFRAPSLYELYSDGGDPTLRPETSRSFDIGVEQRFLDGRLVADLTYFHLEIDNRIFWVDDFGGPPWGYYDQVAGGTTSDGVEASFSYAATDWLDLGGSYTYTNSRNSDGTRSWRVPRHAVTLAATARPAEKWTVSADLKYAADTIDFDWTAYADVKLDDYVLLNAKIAYQVNESTEVYLRGENLLDQDYQVVRGYNTPGIAAYAGFKAKF